MRATRITLKNWMGIESKAFDIGEGGVLIKGKTSIMQAFVSALTGAGIDPESLEAFVKMATADGWQLIGTRVEAGEMVIELLEAA